MYQNDVRPTVNIGETKYLSSAGGSHFQVEQQILKLADRGGVFERYSPTESGFPLSITHITILGGKVKEKKISPPPN